MKVLITGTSCGIGRASAVKFLKEGHTVFGIDLKPDSLGGTFPESKNYTHFAGIQSGTEKDIQVNLFGTMNVTEKYAFQKSIKSVLFISSVSAVTGNEFPEYVASKAGINGYMKNCAIRLANAFRATANSLCFGGVSTELNKPVLENPKLWEKIMEVTPLKKWISAEEAAEWCYFLTVTNTFCTGQEINVSGGERNCADLFVWPD